MQSKVHTNYIRTAACLKLGIEEDEFCTNYICLLLFCTANHTVLMTYQVTGLPICRLFSIDPTNATITKLWGLPGIQNKSYCCSYSLMTDKQVVRYDAKSTETVSLLVRFGKHPLLAQFREGIV